MWPQPFLKRQIRDVSHDPSGHFATLKNTIMPGGVRGLVGGTAPLSHPTPEGFSITSCFP